MGYLYLFTLVVYDTVFAVLLHTYSYKILFTTSHYSLQRKSDGVSVVVENDTPCLCVYAATCLPRVRTAVCAKLDPCHRTHVIERPQHSGHPTPFVLVVSRLHTNASFVCVDFTIGNDSVPIRLAQCWFPWLAISIAKTLIYFSNKLYGSNFIKQHSGTVMV